MTLEELIAAYRDEADDHADPPFCSDSQLVRFANEGQIEAARRAFVLADSTSAMCTIGYAANDETITLDPRILQVRSASIGNEEVRLSTVEQVGCTWPYWRTDTARNVPLYLIRGLDTGKLHLYPRPAVSGTIQLAVYRLPLTTLENDSDEPELRPEWHQSLVDWMLYRAYSRRDSEQIAPQLSAEALARFEAEFGRRTGARNENWSRNGSVAHPAPLA
ncbi:DUF6682 family protein [Variovorax sp. DXTD-1]|uniref:phage adaptor protein n=1 Tax=Variovorax sp. DXTD-1 TaxID=2495592 RepID=UPI000F88E246|nr:DUF6682 family protein [Variovorax sp. DXTD-1]RST54108.1 hypothetical protein EJI00_02990 [Variovorax sp. DXTD-1]